MSQTPSQKSKILSDSKTEPAAESAIADLQKVIARMTPDEKQALRRAGMPVPHGDISQIANNHFKWGVRCSKCNKVGLYLIGERWTFQDIETDVPPAMPHDEIMWTQLIPDSEIDRHTPRCQHCKHPIALNMDGSFERSRGRIVKVVEFEAARDEANDYRTIRARVAKLERLQPEVSSLATEISQNYNSPDEKASKTIDKRFGDGAAQELEQLAQASGAADFRGVTKT